MPGALQLEAMAQMLTVAITTLEGLEGCVTHALEQIIDEKDIMELILFFKTKSRFYHRTAYKSG